MRIRWSTFAGIAIFLFGFFSLFLLNLSVGSHSDLQLQAPSNHIDTRDGDGISAAVAAPVLNAEWVALVAEWQSATGLTWQDDHGHCCGPWICKYYTNSDLTGPFAAISRMASMGTDWQQRAGWSFDGVPELQGRKEDFSVRCASSNAFKEGRYHFLHYVQNSGEARVLFDGKELEPEQLDRYSTLVQGYGPMQVHAGQHVVVLEIRQPLARDKPLRAFSLLSWVRLNPDPSSTNSDLQPPLSPTEQVSCLASPYCFGPMVKCHSMDQAENKAGEEQWGLCMDYVPDTSNCLVYSVGIRDIYKTELAMGLKGCEVHAFDCTVNHAETLGTNVRFYPWCIGNSADEVMLDGYF